MQKYMYAPLYQPTSMRAIRARYDPYLQTRHRVEQVSQSKSSVKKMQIIPQEIKENTFIYIY